MDIIYNTAALNEQELVEACSKGERWAQKIIYETYFEELMPVCNRYSSSPSEAMDMLHEGFIKIFRNFNKYKPSSALGAWMRRIMINSCIDYYRKEYRRRTSDIETTFHLSSNDVDAVSQCTEKEILAAIQKLSPTYRTIFNLFAIEGYSHNEISELLGITPSTSRSNLVKARQKLKVMLANLNKQG